MAVQYGKDIDCDFLASSRMISCAIHQGLFVLPGLVLPE